MQNGSNLQVMIQLYKNTRRARKGRQLWRKLISRYSIDNTAVILMPSTDSEINFYALLYLDQMIESRNFDDALILTYDPVVNKCAYMFSKKVMDVKYFSREKAEALMQYYRLYEFDNRLIVASLEEPCGRNGSVFATKKGITSEEIFVTGVYRVYPVTRPKLPQYVGKDEKVKRFIYG